MGDSEPIEFRRAKTLVFLRERTLRTRSQKTNRNDTKARKPNTARRAIAQCGKLLELLELSCKAPPVADGELLDEDVEEDVAIADILAAADASEAAEASDEEDMELNTEFGKLVSI